jgi:hypothetical protein
MLSSGQLSALVRRGRGSTYKRPYESYFVAVRRYITHPKEGSHRHKRPKVWTLTLEEFVQVIETTAACHYCAEPLVWPPAFGASKWRSNLDRKDNDQGYTAENVVGCCFSCNTTKSNKLRYEEMLLVGAYRRQHPYSITMNKTGGGYDVKTEVS